VAGGEEDPVGLGRALGVVLQDGQGDQGRGGVALVYQDLEAVGGQDRKGGGPGGLGEGVGVLGQEDGPRGPKALPEVGDGQMARTWASVKVALRLVPRWPLVPKATRSRGFSGSGSAS